MDGMDGWTLYDTYLCMSDEKVMENKMSHFVVVISPLLKTFQTPVHCVEKREERERVKRM
jgi:hypothetical protein